jgi:hypothetical protein
VPSPSRYISPLTILEKVCLPPPTSLLIPADLKPWTIGTVYVYGHASILGCENSSHVIPERKHAYQGPERTRLLPGKRANRRARKKIRMNPSRPETEPPTRSWDATEKEQTYGNMLLIFLPQNAIDHAEFSIIKLHLDERALERLRNEDAECFEEVANLNFG